jgi:hypothetical protein
MNLKLGDERSQVLNIKKMGTQASQLTLVKWEKRRKSVLQGDHQVTKCLLIACQSNIDSHSFQDVADRLSMLLLLSEIRSCRVRGEGAG